MISAIFVLCIAYTFLFCLSVFLKDNSIADIFWGVGFMIIAGVTFLFSDRNINQIILTGLIFLWGIRLTLYIGSKKLYKHGEDLRYALWRKRWKYFYLRSFFQVYILQMALMCIIAIPIFLINSYVFFVQSTILLCLGLGVAFFGLIFETIADYQLAGFIKTKKPGEIFMTGLYAYSRHPNYFGESVFWFGISLIGFQVSNISFISFFTITFLLLFVSGVPLLEKRYEGNQQYDDYKKRFSIFIPWFQKKI